MSGPHSMFPPAQIPPGRSRSGRRNGRRHGHYDVRTMIRDILGTSRFLIILAVLGTFAASATLQVFGLLRVFAVIAELIRVGDVSSAAAKSLIADTVAIIDIFLIGTVLFVISAGLYQLFVQRDVALPGWLRIESLDDLKDNLTEVIVVAILVAFLGQAVEWTSDIDDPRVRPRGRRRHPRRRRADLGDPKEDRTVTIHASAGALRGWPGAVP